MNKTTNNIVKAILIILGVFLVGAAAGVPKQAHSHS